MKRCTLRGAGFKSRLGRTPGNAYSRMEARRVSPQGHASRGFDTQAGKHAALGAPLEGFAFVIAEDLCTADKLTRQLVGST